MGNFKTLLVSLVAFVLLQVLTLANPAPNPQITPPPALERRTAHSCYTATATAKCPCPFFNPATCGPHPDCEILETKTIPCKDPKCPVTTTTTVCDCPHCQTGCGTFIVTDKCTGTAAPAMLRERKTTHSCYTATVTTGKCFCPLFDSATCGPTPDCILLETMTIPCKDPKCPVTKTTTVCDCPHCQTGCATATETEKCTHTKA